MIEFIDGKSTKFNYQVLNYGIANVFLLELFFPKRVLSGIH